MTYSQAHYMSPQLICHGLGKTEWRQYGVSAARMRKSEGIIVLRWLKVISPVLRWDMTWGCPTVFVVMMGAKSFIVTLRLASVGQWLLARQDEDGTRCVMEPRARPSP